MSASRKMLPMYGNTESGCNVLEPTYKLSHCGKHYFNSLNFTIYSQMGTQWIQGIIS